MAPVTSESEQEWLRVHAYLNRNRHDLAVRAAGRVPSGEPGGRHPAARASRVAAPVPVPLGDVRLEFRQQAPAPRVTDIADIAPEQLPVRADGTRYRRYSDVVLSSPPRHLREPRTYRLLEADLTGERPHLTFTRGRFFDSVDVGGPAAHEFAAAELRVRPRPALPRRHRGPVGPGRAPAASPRAR